MIKRIFKKHFFYKISFVFLLLAANIITVNFITDAKINNAEAAAQSPFEYGGSGSTSYITVNRTYWGNTNTRWYDISAYYASTVQIGDIRDNFVCFSDVPQSANQLGGINITHKTNRSYDKNMFVFAEVYTTGKSNSNSSFGIFTSTINSATPTSSDTGGSGAGLFLSGSTSQPSYIVGGADQGLGAFASGLSYSVNPLVNPTDGSPVNRITYIIFELVSATSDGQTNAQTIKYYGSTNFDTLKDKFLNGTSDAAFGYTNNQYNIKMPLYALGTTYPCLISKSARNTPIAIKSLAIGYRQNLIKFQSNNGTTEFTYNGSSQSVSTKLCLYYDSASSFTGGKDFDGVNTTKTDAGNYTASFTLKNDSASGKKTLDDYYAYTYIQPQSTLTFNWKIKADTNTIPSWSPTTTVTKTYDPNNAQTFAAGGATSKYGSVTYSLKSTNLSGATINSSTGVVTIPAGAAGGSYSIVVTATSPGNSNYTSTTADKTFTVTINAKTNSVSWSPTTSFGLEFLPANQTVNVGGASCSSGSISYSIQNNGGMTNASINSSGVITVPSKTAIKSYTLTVRASSPNVGSNWSSTYVDKSITITVGKRNLNQKLTPSVTLKSGSNNTFNGKSKYSDFIFGLKATNVSGQTITLEGNTDWSLEIKDSQGITISNYGQNLINAGTYTAIFHSISSSNYSFDDVSTTFTITPWNISNVINCSVTPKSQGSDVYNGKEKAQDFIFSATLNGKLLVGNQDWTYDLYSPDGVKLTTPSQGMINAGVYKAHFKPVANGNYTFDEKIVDVEVKKANGGLTLSSSSASINYSNSSYFNITSNVSGGSLSLSNSDSSVASASISGNKVTYNALKVGTTTITVISAATGNYNEARASFTLTVNPLPVNDPSASSVNFTYSGSTINLNPSYDSSRVKMTGTVSATNAGNYAATFTLNDTTNTCWASGGTNPKTINWTISPKTSANLYTTINGERSTSYTVMYDGQSKKPDGQDGRAALAVYDSDRGINLEEGLDKDWSLTAYRDGAVTDDWTSVGIIDIEITLHGNYTGTLSVEFVITTDYSISYVTFGGEIQGDAPTTYRFNVGATLPTEVNHGNYGNESFKGWYTKNGSLDNDWGDAVTEISNTDKGDKTFYARYNEYGKSVTDSYSDSSNGIRSDEILYVKNDLGVDSDIAVYFWGPSIEGWSDISPNENGFVKVTAPKGANGSVVTWDSAIVCRVDKNNWDHSWAGVYNQTDDISLKNISTTKNVVRLTDWGSGNKMISSFDSGRAVTRSGLFSGDSIYLDTQGSSYDWYKDDAKFVIYFFNDTNAYAYSGFLTRVNGTCGYGVDDDESYPLFETLVPTDNGNEVIWQHCVAIRVNPTCTDPTQAFDSQYKWAQTYNLSWTSTTCFEKNVIKITGGKTGDDSNANLDYERTYEYRADAYENYLYRWFCETCEATYGHTNLDDMKSNWNSDGTRANGDNFENQYKNMHRFSQGIFWLEEGVPSEDFHKQTAFLYDYCIRKYGTDNLTDFANRFGEGSVVQGTSPNYRYINNDDSNNQSIILIVVISSVSLISLCGLSIYLFSKKKHN